MGEERDEQVADAYRRCRRMQRRHDPTYYAATSCLPRAKRPAVHALYGYVRGADEIADSPAAADSRRAALDAWEAELRHGLDSGASHHPVIAALVDAGPRHGMPLDLMPRYMDAMRADCEPTVRIASQDQLERYMEGTGTVGQIIAPLLGAPPGADTELARLGAGFQLTNLIRDVDEDWAMGRIYLPGLKEDDLQRRAATHRLREHIAIQVARARELFRDADALARVLPGPVRPGVRIAVAVYVRVLDRVERHDYDVLTRSPALRPWEAAGAAAAGLTP